MKTKRSINELNSGWKKTRNNLSQKNLLFILLKVHLYIYIYIIPFTRQPDHAIIYNQIITVMTAYKDKL